MSICFAVASVNGRILIMPYGMICIPKDIDSNEKLNNYLDSIFEQAKLSLQLYLLDKEMINNLDVYSSPISVEEIYNFDKIKNLFKREFSPEQKGIKWELEKD